MARVAADPSRQRWHDKARVYAMDGALLGLFMVSACANVVLLEHPASPVHPRLCGKLSHDATITCFVGCDCLKEPPHG